MTPVILAGVVWQRGNGSNSLKLGRGSLTCSFRWYPPRRFSLGVGHVSDAGDCTRTTTPEQSPNGESDMEKGDRGVGEGGSICIFSWSITLIAGTEGETKGGRWKDETKRKKEKEVEDSLTLKVTRSSRVYLNQRQSYVSHSHRISRRILAAIYQCLSPGFTASTFATLHPFPQRRN